MRSSRPRMQAYRSTATKDVRLEGVEQISGAQLFFVAFLHCASPASPHGIVNSALRNVEGFTHSFNCSPGVPMNPDAQCSFFSKARIIGASLRVTICIYVLTTNEAPFVEHFYVSFFFFVTVILLGHARSQYVRFRSAVKAARIIGRGICLRVVLCAWCAPLHFAFLHICQLSGLWCTI